MAIRIIRNVPADQVDAVERLFTDSGAISVLRSDEGDGEFTITAIFPDVERHADLAARLNQVATDPSD